MWLKLIIDGTVREMFYMDESIVFKNVYDVSFRKNFENHEKAIKAKVAEIKQDYWVDIECAMSWQIVLCVKSKIGREEYADK